MIYKHWGEFPEELIKEMTEERIIREMIHNLIRDIHIDELEHIFNVVKQNRGDSPIYPYNSVAYLVTIESDMTREELEIKAELIKQLKNGSFK